MAHEQMAPAAVIGSHGAYERATAAVVCGTTNSTVRVAPLLVIGAAKLHLGPLRLPLPLNLTWTAVTAARDEYRKAAPVEALETLCQSDT